MKKVNVIGAGLAGCEAAHQLALQDVAVDLYEMKPHKYTDAHSYSGFAELVCSNSLKAKRPETAAGMLKEEMRLMHSLLLECAAESSVEAGGALAVDRTRFSDLVTERIRSNPLITVIEKEVEKLPDGVVIIATGPLTSQKLIEEILRFTQSKGLRFYDAAAPIVTGDSIDLKKAFFAARYDRGDKDYINCPMNREEYERFHSALVHAESAPVRDMDQAGNLQVYEGCMPVEVMAKRGLDSLRFGPLKPVGLKDPKTGHRPWAVLQLRKENKEGSLYNLVGCQTNLKFGEQKRVFSMIPGLEYAEFIRYGVMHRNTFIDSPRLLKNTYQLRNRDTLFFAGQITGVEGYIESAASGILAGLNAARLVNKQPLLQLPEESMLGALSKYISDPTVMHFQPMGANMGILPMLQTQIRDKKERYTHLSIRGIQALEAYFNIYK